MNPESGNEFDPRLLDLHLGQLADEQRDEVLALLGSNAELAEQHAILTSVFAALDDVRREDAPAGAAERIAARVAAATRRPRYASPPADLSDAAESSNRPVIIPFRGMRDIIAVAAMIVFAVGLGIPGLLSVRERGQRINCSANLASIGQGLQSYAAANNASLPFAGWGQQMRWAPYGDPAEQVMPNRQHLYGLVLGRYVPPQRFVCPSRMDTPMSPEQVSTASGFPESSNVSYAYQNMARVRPTLADDGDLVVLSDDNPLFDDGLPLLDTLRQGLAGPDHNSTAHRGRGQNILSLSGHVRWSTTPNCGLDGDNIWTIQGVEKYTGQEGPASTRDAHMLK